MILDCVSVQTPFHTFLSEAHIASIYYQVMTWWTAKCLGQALPWFGLETTAEPMLFASFEMEDGVKTFPFIGIRKSPLRSDAFAVIF